MARNDLRAKIRLEGDSTGANRAITKTEKGFAKFSSSIKRNIIGVVAGLVAMRVAFRGVTEAGERAGQSTAFARGLAAQGVQADEFIAKLREVSQNQISNADLILASNRAIALGIKADALPDLLDTAAKASVKLGISMTAAFNDITTGVGRASPLILDNLGIVIDAVKVYAAFAESVGKTTEELTKSERTQALANAVIRGGAEDTFDFADAQNELTRSINITATALKNMKDAIFQVSAGLLSMATGGGTAVLILLTLLLEGVVKLSRGFIFLLRVIPGVDSALEGTAETLKRFDDELDVSQQSMAKFTLEISKAGVNMVLYALQLKKAEENLEGIVPAAEKVTRSIREVGEAADVSEEFLDEFGDEIDAAKLSSEALRVAMLGATGSIRDAGIQAITTARQFDALRKSAGDAAAVAAVIAGGGRLSQGGTRIRLPGGGSRLVNTQGGIAGVGLSAFGTGGLFTVEPDGSLRPS